MSNQVPISSPFIYGRPVRGDEFLSRERELRTIFNRVYNGESTVVSGEPHIGKTSLLLQLADQRTQRRYLGGEAERFVFVNLDLHPIGAQYEPVTFWEEVFDPLLALGRYDRLAASVERAATRGYDRRSLERVFTRLERHGLHLVLLLDEFERLLTHPNFQDPAFFALLRSLATRTGALAIVPASRLSVAEMNQQGRGLLETGSPFFNNTIELPLRPFDEKSVGKLLDRGGFDAHERAFVCRVAGRHPFLLQAMAATLLEATDRTANSPSPPPACVPRIGRGGVRADAAERFYERIASHFDDLWYTLDDRTRTTAVILSLLELGGQVYGEDFNYGEIERSDIFGQELRRLADLGLAEQVQAGIRFDWPELLVWRDGQWRVAAQAFAWWVRDVVIAEARQVPTYDEWLHKKRYRFLLTQQQWDGLVNGVRNAPEWAVGGVGGLARALWDALWKGE
ncbi:MAG: AAA family ATPase [Ardenticatenaceae bacterium]